VLKTAPISPAQPWCAETHPSPGFVLASRKASTYSEYASALCPAAALPDSSFEHPGKHQACNVEFSAYQNGRFQQLHVSEAIRSLYLARYERRFTSDDLQSFEGGICGVDCIFDIAV